MIETKEIAKNLAAGAEALGASMEKFSERVQEASQELQALSAMLPVDVGSALSVPNASPKRGEKFKLTEVHKPSILTMALCEIYGFLRPPLLLTYRGQTSGAVVRSQFDL